MESGGFPGTDAFGNHVTCCCWCTAFNLVRGQRSEVCQAVCRDLPSVNRLYGDVDFIFQQDLVTFSLFVLFRSSETPNVGFSLAVRYEDDTSLRV